MCGEVCHQNWLNAGSACPLVLTSWNLKIKSKPDNTFLWLCTLCLWLSTFISVGGDQLKKPKLLKTMNCYIDKLSVTLPPGLDKFEEELCKQLNEDRINRENKVADGRTVSVVDRKMQVCRILFWGGMFWYYTMSLLLLGLILLQQNMVMFVIWKFEWLWS